MLIPCTLLSEQRANARLELGQNREPPCVSLWTSRRQMPWDGRPGAGPWDSGKRGTVRDADGWVGEEVVVPRGGSAGGL